MSAASVRGRWRGNESQPAGRARVATGREGARSYCARA